MEIPIKLLSDRYNVLWGQKFDVESVGGYLTVKETDEFNQLQKAIKILRESQKPSTSDEALHIYDVGGSLLDEIVSELEKKQRSYEISKVWPASEAYKDAVGIVKSKKQ